VEACWKAANEESRYAYEVAVRALGVEPNTNLEDGNLVSVTASLPRYYEEAISVLIQGQVAPEAITHQLIASATDTIARSK
jgi:hypothetical protein